MIISTTDERLRKILSGICLPMPDGSGYSVATNTAKQLAGLAAALSLPKYNGTWTISFDDQTPAEGSYAEGSYNDLTASLDPKTAQAFVLAPGFIGADSVDLIDWLETVYRQPVTMENYGRVAQFFRIWYLSIAPDEYHNPPDEPPASIAEASLYDNSAARNRRTQKREAELLAIVRKAGWKSVSEMLTAIRKGEVQPPQKT